jgi:hypothetical protein
MIPDKQLLTCIKSLKRPVTAAERTVEIMQESGNTKRMFEYQQSIVRIEKMQLIRCCSETGQASLQPSANDPKLSKWREESPEEWLLIQSGE